jgi:hypothetical protein
MKHTPPTQSQNAAIVRLTYAKTSEFNDVLNELLDEEEVLEQVVDIVEKKIDQGYYVINDSLAKLIISTGRQSLFTKVRNQIFSDTWALLKLYVNRYQDGEIEQRLCETLYGVASSDDDPWRRCIAEAMRDVGSELVLPVLEAIRFDLQPTVQAKQVFADAISRPSDEFPQDFRSKLRRALPQIEASSRAEFVQLVSLAIDAIKERAFTPLRSPAPPEVPLPDQPVTKPVKPPGI